VTIEGTAPKASAYGSHDSSVAFAQALYDQAAATAARCSRPERQPSASEAGTHRAAAVRAAARTRATGSSPRATGLSGRPVRWSRAASIQSLLQPTDSWPLRKAAVTSSDRQPSPVETARAVAMAVTAAVGSGWLARTRGVHGGSLPERGVTLDACARWNDP
jgi:hypothetical protein